MTTPALRIRNLIRDDYIHLAHIDKAVSGEYKPEYWKRKLEVYGSNPELCLGAEKDGQFLGFVLAYVKGGEFGIRDEVGWLEVVGIHPEQQHQGVATSLCRALFKAFELQGIDKVYVQINWNDTDMVGFLDSFGFHRGNLISLEKSV